MRDIPGVDELPEELASALDGGAPEETIVDATPEVDAPPEKGVKTAPDPAEVIAGLAQLDPVVYDRARQAEAQRLGIRVGTLDQEVRRIRKIAIATGYYGAPELLADQVSKLDADPALADHEPDSTASSAAQDDGAFPNMDAAKARVREEEISLEDFYAYMPTHNYIHAPSRAHWPSSSVDARLPRVELMDASGQPVLDEKTGKPKTISPAAWLDKQKPVEQMTWAPGAPMIIRNKLILEGGWIDHGGATVFNLYRPPEILPGDPVKATKWLDHIHYIYSGEAERTIDWLAHRVQRPQEKINHALVLGGPQGIGKDTILELVRYAVGPWNFQEASPKQVFGRFNGFLRAVILRLSEARDLGEHDRFSFYDHMKTYTAAPPEGPEVIIPCPPAAILSAAHSPADARFQRAHSRAASEQHRAAISRSRLPRRATSDRGTR